MYALNLPSFDAKIRKNGDGFEIFDSLRRKYVALTPEEWVRQHFVHYLITEKKYPASRIANEAAIRLNSLTRRCDSVVYNIRLEPVMIIEYKEPGITITQQVFDQVARYNSVLRVPYIVVSNGISHYCYRIDYETQTYTFLTDIPMYTEL
ncbi:MAG: type I restriction enzyme HsdR N-terminal domain-containing protein [Proteiniphilum sp.]|nr:type I restriction enzyme HsdR N-terminal domain-containing protein [Proteiniphilum sp.]